ncbi:aldehyde dehydrogenase family protein [Cognatishimia sp. WU-CL00825]|uniref:aldehyde dehydrogenase family protein n=1 Tax=Cognatishimia sp. WU-CL00825 TaxID=3127658 RepID=UPI0031089DCC
MSFDFQMIVDGKSVPSGSEFVVHNPATGQVVGHAPEASLQNLNDAVAAANKAFLTWRALPDVDRQGALVAIADKLDAHAEELAQLLTQEQGKPLGGMGSRWEVEKMATWARFTAKMSLPVEVIQDNEAGRVELHRKPLGVVGSITPWNFPLLISMWHVAPALLSGNTVVIKPSPYTPLATLRAVELMNEVLPAGVLNVVTGSDAGAVNVGAAMSSHADIRKMMFTGSCATGEKVMQAAASTMKRLTLEMGGNDAAIVLPDVDAKAIAPALFWGAFINNGQTCGCMKRLYIHADVCDDVIAALVEFAAKVPVGDGLLEGSQLGPIQNQMQFDKVARLVAQAKESGKVELGGVPGEGLFFPPTIISGLSNANPLVSEEQFGPALPIIKYSSIEQAIAMANDSDNGLCGSVWSSDVATARNVAGQLECGTVWVNKHGALQPNAPFGGMKKSGLGVEFGEEGLKAYTDIQVIMS